MRKAASLLLAGFIVWASPPSPAHAGALFSDGYLGLTQKELRAKLGPPQKIRDISAGLRVYRYYAFEEWENVLKDQIPGAIGEDVYYYVRDKINIRYSFLYVAEDTPNSDTPTLIVRLVEIEFLSPDPFTGSIAGPVTAPLAVPLADIPKLVPEFKPSLADDAPTFRSNLFIMLIQNQTSKEARRLIKGRGKDDYDWSLSYRLYTSDVLPSRLTLSNTVNRMEIAVESVQLINDHNKLTHEAMVNPFSAKAASLPPAPEPSKKKVPTPKYAP